MIAAFVLGIKWAILVATLGDMLGALFVLQFGSYFFGFTLNWILAGAVFGLFLYRKRNEGKIKLLVNIIISSIIVLVPIQIFLGSYWLQVQFFPNLSYWYILGFRAWTFAIVMVIQIVVTWPLLLFIKDPIERFLVIDETEDDNLEPDDDDSFHQPGAGQEL